MKCLTLILSDCNTLKNTFNENTSSDTLGKNKQPKRKWNHLNLDNIDQTNILSSELMQPVTVCLFGANDDGNVKFNSSESVKSVNESNRSKKSFVSYLSEDDIISSIKTNDRRKYNKGSLHRKTYSIDVKKRAVLLRDSGISLDDVAKLLGTAKSNIEKWCSVKVNFILKNCKHVVFLHFLQLKKPIVSIEIFLFELSCKRKK